MEKLGKYKIIKEIGKGAMGIVYLAFDPVIERQVAIKTMNDESFSDKEQRARFFREAKSAGGLQHPNIVTIYDMGESDGLPYIVMEFVEGDDLDELIAKGSLSLEEKLNIIIQLCEALSFAHSQGIVHRDIKPSNIRVLKNKKVKVMDFGIAKKQDSDLTRTGLVVGTISYMSPEQIQGKPISSKSDQFSAGTVFYQLMTGKKPFEGENITSVIFKIISLKPEALDMEGVPVFIANIIKKMMANDTEHRFPDCKDVADVLKSEIQSLNAGKNEIETAVIKRKPAADNLPPIPVDKTSKLKAPPSNRRVAKSTTKKKSSNGLIVAILIIAFIAIGLFLGIKGVKKVKKFFRNKSKIAKNQENLSLNENLKQPSEQLDNKENKTNLVDNKLSDKTKPTESSPKLKSKEDVVKNEKEINSQNDKKNELKPKVEDKKDFQKDKANNEKIFANKNKNESPNYFQKKKNVPLKNKDVFIKKGDKKVITQKFHAFEEFKERIEAAKKHASRMQPRFKKARSLEFFNKGRNFLGNKAYKSAAFNFYMSIIFDPRNAHSYANLVISLEKIKAYKEANKVLKQAQRNGISISEMSQNVMFRDSYDIVIANN